MKNRLGFALFLLVAVVILPDRVLSAAQNGSPQAEANGAPPLANPLKVALLRWYKANTVYTRFPVGKEPVGIAFDGASIWTANSGDGTVTKLRASDGTLLGTFNLGTVIPYGATFDGENIWVTGGIYIVELRASDGAQLGLFKPLHASTGVAFDGANIWVSFYTNNTVAKM